MTNTNGCHENITDREQSNTYLHISNAHQQFDFDFFTSKDNQQIRWGYMRARLPSVQQKIVGSKSRSESKGVLLLLNGRTEFMEKYRAVASRLSSMGYHVISFDWRGQGLSVRELSNHDKGYVRDFHIYINDLALFYNLHVEPRSIELKLPVTILAHSMGGHIALRFLSQFSNSSFTSHTDSTSNNSNALSSHINIQNIKKAILISPMIDIVTSPIQGDYATVIADWGSRRLAYLAVKAGLGGNYIPGGKDYCRKNVQFKDNLLTHDWDNFWLEHMEIEKNQNLALGGVTWGWLKAAFDSIAILKDDRYLSCIKTAVVIFSAEEDRVVSNKAQQSICNSLPNGKFISIPKARHEILFETVRTRELLWSKISLEV